MAQIKFFDTTLRDGEQTPGVNLNKLEKVEIARQLERLGMDVLEAGFPASSEGDFLAVQEIAKTIKTTAVTALARAKKSDIDTAWEALKDAEQPRIHVFLATSPIHMEYKLKKTPEEVLRTAVEMVTYAKERFPIVQFSAEDASRSELPFLAQVVEAVIDAGATVVNLPDTVGYATPAEYGKMFAYMKEHVSNIEKADLSAHCHDDLGMAVANSIAAIENGATQIEGTVNGIGERAGNAALEEIAVALHIRKDAYEHSSRLVLHEIKRTSSLISKLTGMTVPGNKAIVGDHAFAHESGIHQDGMLKHAETYEIITPALVGMNATNLVLGKHSGRHAFHTRIAELGFALSDVQLQEAFDRFKRLTDKKKEITDDDLFTIALDIQTKHDPVKTYEVKALQVTMGPQNLPTATIALQTPEHGIKETARTGHGTVEAIYNTLAALIDEKVTLTDYRIHSVGKGEDALAEVHVQLQVDGDPFTGRGTANDVLKASSHAFVNGVNRALRAATMKKVQALI